MNDHIERNTKDNASIEAYTGDHKKSPKNRQSARKVQAKYPKGDVRHWESRVKKDASKHFYVQIAHGGERHRFTWKESNAERVAPLALKIYQKILVNGWKAALEQHKPETAKPIRLATVGELITEVQATAGFRPTTFRAYVQSLRQIASQIANIGNQPKLDENGQPVKDGGRIVYLNRRSYLGGGTAAWIAKVDAVSLGALTPEAVQRWRLAYVAKVGTAPDARRHAENTATSLIRNARALFSEIALEFPKEKLLLPSPLPFAGVKLPDKGNMRYQSKINHGDLIAAAKKDLAGAAFQIFALAMLCGLRKREIDLLTWAQVDFTASQVLIERTEWFEPKSEDSIGTVDIDPELLALLRGWKATATGPFVIESHIMPREKASLGSYRIQSEFKTLYTWLRGKGVTANKPLHELRKELGSLLASDQGIFAAQSVLRHAQISTTAEYYVDKKRTITAGLGKLLAPKTEDNVETGNFTPSSAQNDDKPLAKHTKGRKARRVATA